MSQTQKLLPERSRLVYATGPDGIYAPLKLHAEASESSRPNIVAAANDLAAQLEASYADSIRDVLDKGNYPLPVSQKVAKWIIEKDLHKPTTEVITARDATERFGTGAYDYTDDRGSVRAALTRSPKPGCSVVNFALPKPIDQFLGRTDYDGQPATWGAVYERVKQTPWRLLEQWKGENPDIAVSRLNSVGLHAPGNDGFYYLFEVSECTDDEDVDGGASDLYARLPANAEHISTDPVLFDYMQSEVDKLNEQGFAVQAFTVPQELLCTLQLDELPQGVAIVGGAARAIVQQAVFGEHADVCDVDLVVVNELLAGDIDTDRLSREFMEDDYQYGHGVGYTYLDAYFATRDFTMNEVLVVDGVILATNRAVHALRHKVIRPTEYEADGWEQGIGPKLAMKALLMQAVFEQKYGTARCEGFEPYGADGFYVALALNKAFQYGLPVTRRYLQLIGFSDQPDVDEIIDYAGSLADYHDFQFRGSKLAERVNGEYDNGNTDDWQGGQMFHDLPPIIEHATHLMSRKGTNSGWGDTGY